MLKAARFDLPMNADRKGRKIGAMRNWTGLLAEQSIAVCCIAALPFDCVGCPSSVNVQIVLKFSASLYPETADC